MQKAGGIFNEIKDIGVIWVMNEAAKMGFANGNPDWANLGQGEPEVGPMKGAPDRITRFEIEPDDDRYGPVNGIEDLKTAIASHYNRLYRKNKTSKYTAENVSIAMGARLALTRICATIGTKRIGYKVPEYPAYEDLLNYQSSHISPVCIPSKKEENYSIPAAGFAEAVKKYNLDGFLFSNPCNPTGHVIKEDELNAYVRTAARQKCTLIVDEVYSHFIYENGKPADKPVSAAEFIGDVNYDRVLIVDALTKSFRYPGWRLAWILGPKEIIEDLGRAASGIDGGPSVPIQRAAIQLFEPQRADQESNALRAVFSRKQSIMRKILADNGMICSPDANSTFYLWADISQLPYPLNDSDRFFAEALRHKVIIVPGHLFAIHPGKECCSAEFDQFVRFSFGPQEDNMIMGLNRITDMIKSCK